MSKEKSLVTRTLKKQTSKTEKQKKDIKFFKKQPKDSGFLQPIEEAKNESAYDRALTKYEDYKAKNVEDWLLKVKMVSDDMKNSKSADETFNKGAGDNMDKKYPILNDKELIKKITNVPITNNQKGRIRQLLKDSLQMSTKKLIPDVIHNKIQSIIRNSATLANSDLRKLRILYNMLRNALAQAKTDQNAVNTLKKEKKNHKLSDLTPKATDKDLPTEKYMVLDNKNVINSDKQFKCDKKLSKEKKEVTKEEESKKGPKRYVVFLGNLPLDVDKDQLRDHFRDLRDGIQHIRIPKKSTDKRTAIAYIEFKDELFYQLALSRHHSMLGNKRINVLYTTQKNTKVTQAEAKGKSAKIIALQKSGKLLGSVPLNRKRSQRRKKLKEARAKEARDRAS